jgi:hypothetical protein
MSHHNTSLSDPQDCLICRAILGFLTVPLIFLLMVGTIIAL